MNPFGKWIVLRDGVVVWDYRYRDDAEQKAEPGDEIVYAVPALGARHHLPFAGRPIDDDWITGLTPDDVAAAAAADTGRLL